MHPLSHAFWPVAKPPNTGSHLCFHARLHVHASPLNHVLSHRRSFPPLCATQPRSLSLKPYDLSPSYANVFNKFSVRYFINLVLVDEEDRRYFKQQVGAGAWAGGGGLGREVDAGTADVGGGSSSR